MTHPIHHQHIRKRIHVHHEEYPHPKPHFRFVDQLVFVCGVLGPVLTLPQFFRILETQDANSFSFTTWGAYLLFAGVWLTYGILHKEKPIIVTNALYLLVDIAVVVIAAYYRFLPL